MSAAGVLRRLHSLGHCLNLAADSDDLFNRILYIFMVEFDRRAVVLPLPAVLANGAAVELFKMYMVVAEKGGYDAVTAAKEWAAVAAALGFGPELTSAVRLMYFKYLGALNPLLRTVLGEEVEVSGDPRFLTPKNVGSSGSSGVIILDPEVEEKGCRSPALLGRSPSRFLTPIKNSSGAPEVEKKGSESPSLLGSRSSRFLTPKKHSSGSSGVADGDQAAGRELFSSLRRKRGSAASPMLEWLARAARCASDPSIVWVSSSDGEKVVGGGSVRLMSQALVLRRLMFSKAILPSHEDESPLEKRQKVHPSLFEDKRCSNRLRSLDQPSHSGSTSGTTDLMASTAKGKNTGRTLRSSSSLSALGSGLLYRDPKQARIPRGPSFQASVPKWTRMPVASRDSHDLKWLGTRIWPPEQERSKTPSGSIPIEEGREDNCKCQCPGSTECVRFHVVDKRRHLKSELGSAFDDLGFNCMGEEAALSWTEEEERRFKAIVRLNPLYVNTKLWDQLCLAFPLKGIQNIVSYYFNVFVLRHLSYQNRMTQGSIDSDEEERNYEFLSRPFNLDAVKARDRKTTLIQMKPNEASSPDHRRPSNPKTTSCTLNTEVVDLTSSSDSE